MPPSEQVLHATGNVFWPVEPIWRGERVFILASGPSLTREITERVRGEKTIVINGSYVLAPWADILFFTDNGWFHAPNRNLDHRAVVENWPGMVMTLSRQAKMTYPKKVRRIRAERRDEFPPLDSGVIRQGRTSGHTAVALSIGLGAAETVLLGFDMRTINGRAHHHDEYVGKPRDLDIYEREFASAFDGWNAAATKIGVRILNATPASAIKEFPFVSLDEVLTCCAV